MAGGNVHQARLLVSCKMERKIKELMKRKTVEGVLTSIVFFVGASDTLFLLLLLALQKESISGSRSKGDCL